MSIVNRISEALDGLKFPKCKIFVLNASSDDKLAWDMITMFRSHGILCWDSQNCMLPGQVRETEQEKAIFEADFVIAIFSNGSQGAEGRYAALLKIAYSAQQERLEGGIKLISVLIESCQLPYEYRRYQPLDLTVQGSAIRLVESFKTEYARRKRLGIKPTKPEAIWL
ncbi:TPA: hypothetical protein DIU27_00835 [Candidatus Collierbacteria bacterium]|uniref:TIR domain-containing protein n=1 Tax=Candidatus Collierbacteria bacterium GW2011_GWB2_44_22 TaxID=1618387 RepID=A0A0G1HZN5_9BACT|nr:MAG: hypothetical protein UW31_C0005G0002 [Candidatus Collierbacteria bacterium GW2011_GWA2_44_13]KKT52450.1 MAG: hypothetical protein UW44_C0001G0002 [Candidatus Collierbacteria bacterium GW2011_GWB2_44_22]KKT61713.1 MAG: hypothetical protein UW56_C0020G0002 [Candidatus Collierbacteria bacterium GW2011_GWD1_44_27]KKT65520.1 MAG: hypothetical protein UW58_C0027G0002 [Candidatus Collierbacteria bacterium GW2011_GWC2_44_30]KKT69153.1 MAG: hypothetical protein UW64_C0003G0003 [Microgenomates gr